MKPAFKYTRYALLALVAVSLGSWVMRTFSSAGAAGAGVALPADGIVVMNFHPATRCNACRGIGSAAPVLVFALALAVSRDAASRAFLRLQSAQRWI